MKYRIKKVYNPSTANPEKYPFRYVAQRKMLFFWVDINWSFDEFAAYDYVSQDFRKRGGENAITKEFDFSKKV